MAPARIEPIDKKQAGRELVIAKEDQGEARDGDLVSVDLAGKTRLGAPAPACASVSARSTGEKAVSLIALRAHDIPDLFRPRRWPRPRPSARRGSTRIARTGAICRSSPSTRPTPRTTTTRSTRRRTTRPDNPGGFVVTVAIADVAHYVRAPFGARPRRAGARQFRLFPRPRRAHAARAHLERSLLAARRMRTGRRSPCGCASTERAQARPSLPSRDDALRGQAQLRPGAGGDRRGTDETTASLLELCLKPLWAAYEVAKHARKAARRSISTCPSARSCSSQTAPSTAS